MRRAVASAVDRQGLAAAFPGSSLSLTDQLLPPGMPGFQDVTIYPYNVTDFTAAAAVVQNAGFGGATVVVYTCNSQICQNQTNALQLTLSRVGLVADIHYLSSAALNAALNNPSEPFDMATFGWSADYADPFDFLNNLLDPAVASFNPSHFNDPAASSEMEAAAALSPSARYTQYAQVDRDLSQTYAPMTGYATGNAHDFFSARVGCQTFNPSSGMDLAALCLASPAVLQGSVAASPDLPDPPDTRSANLSALGTTDWAVWGYANSGTSTSLAPDVRKAGGSAISDLTNIDPAPSVNLRGIGQFAEPFAFSWTNGSPPASATNASAGLQHDGQTQALSTLGHGFAFDVPADTSARTLRVYVLTNRADGRLTATLSDTSAPAFFNTLPSATNTRSAVYTITYAAQSAGQKLHVQWVETQDNCPSFHCDNAAIFAVALTDSNTLVVNDPGDADGSICGPSCTLRQAINAANAAPGSTIVFDLPADQTTISPTSNLPTITAPTTIDATTQPGYAGTPVVTIDGSNNVGGGFTPGFFLLGNNITIRGFVIIDFADTGIYADNSNGDTIAGNYIGMVVGGINSPNGNGITLVESSDGNTIGGTGSGDRNVISANAGFGIDLQSGEGGAPDNNTIAGNYIGLKPDGTGTAGVTGNLAGGMRIDGDDNTIGGTTAAARNYVSANDDTGIAIGGAGNIVQGNTIGLDAATDLPAANSGEGIDIAPFNSLAPASTIEDNVISGNFGNGIRVAGVESTMTIAGNLIGTDPTGTLPIGNGEDGIHTNDAALLTINGNTISGNLDDGIHLFGFGSHSNLIEANKIGTNAAGTAPIGNTANGIYLDQSNVNRVNANTISGNLGSGVVLEGSYETSVGDFVTGNLIGTNAAGTASIGNGTGVQVFGAINNVIGGSAIGDANTISGNIGVGVEITGAGSTGNTVSSNTIGLNLTKNAELPNATGVMIEAGADTNTVGGTLPLEPNLISGNSGAGVLIDGAGDGGNTVIGNLIGTNAAQTSSFGNGVGVRINGSNNNTIGQNAANQPNVISGNAGAGVRIEGNVSTTNLVEGNFIGTDDGATLDLGNSGDGAILIDPANHNIVRRNTIIHNGGAGVAVPDSGRANNITANSIDLNAGLGIDNGVTGITANDNEVDGFQNFPTVTTVSTTTINGTLSSFGNTTFNVDLFDSPACDASGNGEGATYLGTTTASTDDSGNGTFTASVPPLSSGHFVTATAIDPDGNTSEFSPCVATVLPPVVANLSLTPTPESSPAGAPRVKLADVPPSVLLRPQSTSQTAPVNETPVNETPVNELPVNELPVNEVPVNELGFDDLSSTVPALGNVTLASIPLLRTGGWQKVLSDPPGTPLAGLPLQNVTLRDYYALPANVNPETRPTNQIPPITLADLDLSHSPLGSLPSSALVLANVKLSDMRSLTVWCEVFGTAYCTNPTSLTGQTVMSAALQGAPVNETPVNETPVNEIPVNEVPVNETPVNEVPVNELPVNETPVNELPVNETPVNELPVNELTLEANPVNETPVNELPVNEIMSHNTNVVDSPVNELPVNELATPNDVIFCAPPLPSGPGTVDCATATLKQAYDAGAIKPGVTLGDLRRADDGPPNAFDGITLGDLNFYGDVTLRGLVDSFPDGTITLGDYFLLVLRSPTASQGLAWERLNLSGSGLAQFSTGGSTVDYRGRFDVQPNGGPSGVPSKVTVSSTLASGFLYVPGTSKLAQSPADCSTATPIVDPTSTTLNDGRLKLTWSIDTIVGNSYSVCFKTRPGIELGPQAASIDAKPTGSVNESATGGTLSVGDTLEPNDAAASAPQLSNDSFYLSYLTSSTDVDFYRFAAPPAGTVVTFHLSHVPADYDLVVYGPPETPLRPAVAGAVPLDEPPVTDSGADLTHTTDPLPSQTLDDLRLQPDLPMVGVSASRGTDPEDVVVISPGGSGFYTIQVTGYNGATSSSPYMIRAATSPPRQTSNVPARTITGTAGPALPALPNGLNTVFLVNRRQMEGLYGSTAASSVMTALSNNSTAFRNLGFPNVVLSVERFAAVQTAYDAWNLNPGSPAAANGVVAAINAVIDSQIRAQPNGAGLKYLVIVGGDQVIPFARLDDFTVTAGNEMGYASTFAINTDLFSTLNAGQMLSDDPYGDVNPVPYLNRQLYIPELSVGRLIETPAEIVDTLNRFVSPAVSGHLDPTTSLTTGYDFLFDGAQGVNDAPEGACRSCERASLAR